MPLIACPHCAGEVEPTAKRCCPACGKWIDDLGEVDRSRVRQAIEGSVRERLDAGEPWRAIVSAPPAGDPPVVAKVLERIGRDRRARRSEIRRAYLWPGYLALVLGLGVTVGTWAVDRGLYVWAVGPICYGLLSVVTGHRASRRYR